MTYIKRLLEDFEETVAMDLTAYSKSQLKDHKMWKDSISHQIEREYNTMVQALKNIAEYADNGYAKQILREINELD